MIKELEKEYYGILEARQREEYAYERRFMSSIVSAKNAIDRIMQNRMNAKKSWKNRI